MIKLKRVYESTDFVRWHSVLGRAALATRREENRASDRRLAEGHCPEHSASPVVQTRSEEMGGFPAAVSARTRWHSEALRPILDAAQPGNVTLVYSSHDAEHNNAVVLKDYVEEKLHRKSSHGKSVA